MCSSPAAPSYLCSGCGAARCSRCWAALPAQWVRDLGRTACCRLVVRCLRAAANAAVACLFNEVACWPTPPLPADPTLIDQIQDYDGWDFVQVDAALRGSDLHAIGVVVKPLTAAGSSTGGSVDAAAFEALMRRGKGKRQQQQQQQQAGGFQQKS